MILFYYTEDEEVDLCPLGTEKAVLQHQDDVKVVLRHQGGTEDRELEVSP